MRFIDVHSGMEGITREQLEEAHQKDLALAEEEGVHFVHAWADPIAGKVFCLTEADNKEAVLRVHEKAGAPTDEIYEVPLSV